MSGDLGVQHFAFILSAIACVLSLVAIMVRKAAGRGRRPRARYCPRCGLLQRRPDYEVACTKRAPERVVTTHPKPGNAASVLTTGRRRLDAIANPLPSDFLRAGWLRGKGLAMNRHGDRLVNTALDDPEAPVAWSLAGAVLTALEPRMQCAYERVLAEVLLKWHGTTDIDGFNVDPDRQQEDVIAVALETERRLGLGPRCQ